MAIRLVNNDSKDYSSPTSAGAVGLDERLDFVDGKGNTVASITSDADGTQTMTVGGVKRYKALLTQADTDAPVATVLENTLGGTPVWSRSAAGTYALTLTGAFPANKIFAPGVVFGDPTANIRYMAIGRTSDNALSVVVGNPLAPAGMDDILSATPLLIEVYP